jgi:hypothetical protein
LPRHVQLHAWERGAVRRRFQWVHDVCMRFIAVMDVWCRS